MLRSVRALLGLVYAGLVVLVLGVEARLEVAEQRGRRQQLADHVLARQQQARGRVRRRGGRRRGRGAPLAPLRYLALDVERTALRAATYGARGYRPTRRIRFVTESFR